MASIHGRLTAAPSRRTTVVTLAFLMALVAGLLLVGLTRDLPSPEPDEPFFVLPAVEMAAHGSANPHWFGHPASTVIAPLAVLYRAREVVFHGAPLTGDAPGVIARYRDDPSSFYVLGRLWVLLLAVLTVPLVYLVGRRLFSPIVALVATGVWTVLPLVVDYGRLVRSDSAATCFGMLAFLACLRAVDRPTTTRFALAGAAIGLAVSSRYFMITLLVALAGAWWLARRESSDQSTRVTPWPLVGGAAAAFGAFALTTPFFFLDPSATERSLTAENTSYLNSASHGVLGNVAFYLFDALPSTLSWPGYLLAVAGIVLAVVRRDRLPVLAAVFVGTFLLALCPAGLHWQRWVIPVLPFLALFATNTVFDAAGALSTRERSARGTGRFAGFVAVGVVIMIAVPVASVAWGTYAATVPTTRVAMRDDVLRDVPARSPVAVELKGPSLGGAGYPTWHAYDLPKSGTLADYVAHGYHYIVVNTYLALQYRLKHKRWPEHAAFYQFLRWHGHLLADDRPGGARQGPHLKLYRVDATDMQGDIGQSVRSTTRRSTHDRLGGRSREYPVGGELYDRIATDSGTQRPSSKS